MQAKKIMTTDVECISPDTTIPDAAEKMKYLDVGFLPVCKNDRLVGTITDRDIVLRVIAEGKDVNTSKTHEVMTSDVYWCYEDQTSDEVAAFMASKEIRRVLILNREKRLVGVISIGDLAQARGVQKKAGETMKEISQAPSKAA